jgi:drug/metabolite transporter (DMT)-like permease
LVPDIGDFMSSLALLLAVGAAVSWALSQVLTKEGLRRMDFVAYGVVRPLFALPFILAYGLITSGLHFPDLGLVGIAACGGVIDSFLGTLLYMFSLRRSPAHLAAPLSSTAPFWGVVTAVLFLRERPHPVVFVAAVLVVLGAYFLGSHRSGEITGRPVVGTVAALGAGVVWGVAETLPAKYCLAQGMTPITYQLIMVGAAAASWGLLAVWRRRRLPWSPKGLMIAFQSAFAGFFLGWLLWLSGLSLAPASVLAPVRGSTILFSFMFSILLLHERPSLRAVVGLLFVSAGVFLVSIMA